MPENKNFKALLPSVDVDHDLKVIDLMHNYGTWKRELIHHIFQPTGAKQILAMPLSLRNTRDSMLWNFSKSGLYIVKTAYHVALNTYQIEKGIEASLLSSKK